MLQPTLTRLIRLAVIAAVTLFLCAGSGCSKLRAKIRENERQVALANVRAWHGHRDWAKCVASAERAQATPDVELEVARETTLLKANCLYKLGRTAEALAHYHLLRDFQQDGGRELAFPAAIQRRIDHAPSLESVKASPHNQSFLKVEMPGARYTRAAEWSKISGRALVQWTITEARVTRHIRVLNDVHPLLAGLAIEAAASSVVEKDKVDLGLLPVTKRSLFVFGEE